MMRGTSRWFGLTARSCSVSLTTGDYQTSFLAGDEGTPAWTVGLIVGVSML